LEGRFKRSAKRSAKRNTGESSGNSATEGKKNGYFSTGSLKLKELETLSRNPMSDHEDSAQETDQDEDSVLSIYTALLKEAEALMAVLETAEVGLAALQRPMERLALHQLGSVPFLQTSPFRSESFLLKRKPNGAPAGAPEGSRVPISIVCAQLRALTLCLPTEDGRLVLSPYLKEMLHIKARTATFPALLGALTHGLV
jgi:hypothetical protein